ncbi:Thioesterase superfamily protein 5 [Bordetella tumbae]|uniref:acyl-CoA thioesterase n=1 Tax=Bordetella tumbae TaxID=1649139 RepID=UPI0039F091CD
MSQELSASRALQVGDCHHVDLPMRWGDADTLNHMNNTVYFRMMEEARMRMLYGSGMALPSAQGFILAHASCDFVRPFTYPCDVRITHKVTRIGRSSLETDLILGKVGDDTGAYAQGRTVMVWLDYGANCSAPLPDAVLRALAAVCVPAGQG